METKNRVVVTGMGIVAPNGVGLSAFSDALKKGTSGIRFFPSLKELQFSCQIGGEPIIPKELIEKYFTALELRNFNSKGILYGVMAGMDALEDAGLKPSEKEGDPLWDLGIVFGTSTSGIDRLRDAIYQVDEGKVRRLGSTVVAQTMNSGISAYLAGKIGAGNWVTTNSSACATGTEAILMGYEHIKNGKAKQMLCGSCSGASPYIWGGFDALRVTASKYNANPQQASRPMSATANGFVPASGAGALLLEDYETAKKRGAKIYAELLGGHCNNGGQRQGGSMTAPNSVAVQQCITKALQNAKIDASEIDYINGHLTATVKDSVEIENWCEALKRSGDDFPYINSLKSLIGHGLAASGSMEVVGAILQMHQGYIARNINCRDLHPEITKMISAESIPTENQYVDFTTLIKASFGFGDVNACAIFRKI